jgi:hypothetical protein
MTHQGRSCQASGLSSGRAKETVTVSYESKNRRAAVSFNFNSTAMLLAISRNIFLEIARTVYR